MNNAVLFADILYLADRLLGFYRSHQFTTEIINDEILVNYSDFF